MALRALSLPGPKVQEAQGDRREFLVLFSMVISYLMLEYRERL